MAVVTLSQLKALDGYLMCAFTGALGKIAIPSRNFTCIGQDGGREGTRKDKSEWDIGEIEICSLITLTMYNLDTCSRFIVCVGF